MKCSYGYIRARDDFREREGRVTGHCDCNFTAAGSQEETV